MYVCQSTRWGHWGSKRPQGKFFLSFPKWESIFFTLIQHPTNPILTFSISWKYITSICRINILFLALTKRLIFIRSTLTKEHVSKFLLKNIENCKFYIFAIFVKKVNFWKKILIQFFSVLKSNFSKKKKKKNCIM